MLSPATRAHNAFGPTPEPAPRLIYGRLPAALVLVPTQGRTTKDSMSSETDDEAEEQQDLEAQVEIATETIRGAVLRLLREGKVHPQLIVLTAARVAGELGASAALASGQDIEGLLDEMVTIMREAGREHREMLRAEVLPVAGNA